MPFPKPESPRKAKIRADLKHARARQACVEKVWRDRGWEKPGDTAPCDRCSRAVYRVEDAPSYLQVGHVHEKRSRALGGDNTDPDNCELLCHFDHFDGPSGAHTKSLPAHPCGAGRGD